VWTTLVLSGAMYRQMETSGALVKTSHTLQKSFREPLGHMRLVLLQPVGAMVGSTMEDTIMVGTIMVDITMVALGSTMEDQGSTMEDQGSTMEDQGSTMEDTTMVDTTMEDTIMEDHSMVDITMEDPQLGVL